MQARLTKDWFEWIELNRARFRQGFVRVLYDLAGKRQVPPDKHPKAQAPFYDDQGFVRLPEGWERVELSPLTLWVLPMGLGGPPYRPFTWPIGLVGPHFGQEALEKTVCSILPMRMPEPPFAGEVQVEFRQRRRVLWAQRIPTEVAWAWPQEER